MKMLRLLIVTCFSIPALIVGAASAAPIFQMRLVADGPSSDTDAMALITKSRDVVVTNVVNVQKAVLLDQTSLKSAVSGTDPLGHPFINLEFTKDGAKRLAEVTRNNQFRQLAIVIDGKLYQAPVITDEILDGKAQISGGDFAAQTTEELAKKINEALRRNER